MDEAVVDMIVDQRTLGAGDGAFHRLELLSDVDTGTLLLDHADDTAQVTGRAVQTLDDRRMTGMHVVSHARDIIRQADNAKYPPGGIDEILPGG